MMAQIGRESGHNLDIAGTITRGRCRDKGSHANTIGDKARANTKAGLAALDPSDPRIRQK
jgi:hypothetical protein